MVRERPSLALEDVVDAFWRAPGVTISAETVSKYVREAGFVRMLSSRSDEAGDEQAAPLVEQPPRAQVGEALRVPCGASR